ncbi:MAG TPA: MATE family efflux transporter, partial [Bacillota bacterium]|nr:MATE family efflux transporter [Bacillota bacterium]
MSSTQVPEEALEIEAHASPSEDAEILEGETLDEIKAEAKTKSVVMDKETIEYLEKHPGRIGSFILKLALPAIADNVLATVTQMADMIMVGRLGAAAVASVGLSNQPLFLIQGL